MGELYEWLIQFIDFIFYQPTTLSLYARAAFGASTGIGGGALLSSAPYVAPFVAFWLDDDLFPFYFQAATGFYLACFVVNLFSSLIVRIWNVLKG